MKVLFWQELFWPYIGGAEVLAVRLLVELRRRGHEVLVITRRPSAADAAEERFRGLHIHRLSLGGTGTEPGQDGLEATARVAELKAGFAPDLIHVNSLGPSLLLHVLTARMHPAPVLVTLHRDCPEERLRARTLTGSVLRSADWTTAVSVAVLRRLREAVPELSARSSVIYNGIDPPALPLAPLPFDSPRLLCIGRVVPEKGFDVALTAFAALRRRFPRARLSIAGDGSARPLLEQRAAELDLRDTVEFLGWVAPGDVPALINRATIVLVPSRTAEAFALVALEAALMARPVVASRVGGLVEVVVEGRTGLLVAPEDPEALAGAVAELLRHRDRAIAMGVAGRERAREIFSFDRHVDAYESLYRALVHEPADQLAVTGGAGQW